MFQNVSSIAAASSTPFGKFPPSEEHSEKEEEENVIYIDSFFIPHVFDHISLPQLVDLIEQSSPYKGEGNTSIGVVEKIESIPKVNQKNGRSYYSCFVTLSSWSNNEYARSLMYTLYNDEQSRLYYKLDGSLKAEYMAVLPNKSETSMMDAPKHTDLVMYLHPDTRLETVMSVMEGLDIGKIYTIEANIKPAYETSSSASGLWKSANPSMWYQKVDQTYMEVVVCMEYWYKTQTAYNFKREMENATFIEIPVFEGCYWTIYEIEPRFEGVNPYVWVRN